MISSTCASISAGASGCPRPQSPEQLGSSSDAATKLTAAPIFALRRMIQPHSTKHGVEAVNIPRIATSSSGVLA